MRSTLASLFLAGALALGSGLSLHADHETTSADIIRMHKGGLRDETILEFLRTYRARVLLTGRGVGDLAEAGFREEFIRALLDYERTQPPEEKPHPRQEGNPPPYPAPVYPTTFYVGYAYDAWAFPLWFYPGSYHQRWYSHHGYYGRGHYGGHTSFTHSRGFGHSGGGGGHHGGGHGHR